MPRRFFVLTALAGLAAATLAACGGSSPSGPAENALAAATARATTPVSSVRVALAYISPKATTDPLADPASSAAISAVNRAVTAFGVQASMIPSAAGGDTDPAMIARLEKFAAEGYNPIIVLGHTFSGPVDIVAPKYPKTRFAIVDGPVNAAANVTELDFDETQGTFLAGTIAASASRTGKVGFIGGTGSPVLKQFADGFTQGAKAVNPKAKVAVQYVAPEDSGFFDAAGAKQIATQLFKAGNDVLFTVAYNSNAGVFAAAAKQKTLAIGMETDEYAAAPVAERSAILTSMIKDTSVPVYAMIKSAVDGAMLTGTKTFGVQDGAVTYATSNPAMQPYQATADSFAHQLGTGAVKVRP